MKRLVLSSQQPPVSQPYFRSAILWRPSGLWNRLHMIGGLLAILALAWTSTAVATTIIGDTQFLSALTDDGSVLVGDKLFDEFMYTPSGDMPPATAVTVTPILDDDGNYGIRFQGGFIDVPGGGPSDASIKYRVSVQDELMVITDAHLASNVTVAGSGSATGYIEVLEAFNEAPNQMKVSAERNPDGTVDRTLTDWTFFDDDHTVLHIEKRILAIADDQGVSFPTVSFIDQTFSQDVIPEPVSCLLLAMGCLMMTGFNRRFVGRA